MVDLSQGCNEEELGRSSAYKLIGNVNKYVNPIGSGGILVFIGSYLGEGFTGLVLGSRPYVGMGSCGILPTLEGFHYVSLKEGNNEVNGLKKHGKKVKCTKVKENDRKLVLGEGVKFDDIMETIKKVLVGRVRGRKYSAPHLKKGDRSYGGRLCMNY